jgi:hypothetical protein
MLTEPIVQVSVHVTPGTEITVTDRPHPDGPFRVVVLHIGDVGIHVGLEGDPGIVAATGALIDALDLLRRNARGRIAATYTGLPAMPDGLEPATLADAVAGWAPGEIVEVYGS